MSVLDGLLANTQTFFLSLLLRVLAAVAIFWVGRWLARRARNWSRPLVARTTLTESLKELSVRVIYYAIIVGALLVALTVLGVPTTSILAASGVVVVLLGIALQESIGNFAATVIFLLFQPFEVGDLIETGGITGTVYEVQIFNTVLEQADRRMVVLPNAKIQADGIINYSKSPVLRVDLVVGISYADDIAHAKAVLRDLLAEDERVLADPPPQIVVLALADSSVNLGVRPFVHGKDYWLVLWALTEQIKTRFDEEGITIPFPQREVHLPKPLQDEAAAVA